MLFKIKEYRAKKNISQEELSKKSGISRSTISGLESGRIKVTTTATLVRLASALGIPVEKILP